MTGDPSAGIDAGRSGERQARRSVTTSRVRSTWSETATPPGAELIFVRAALGVVGIGGVGLASYAVFKTRDGTATVALIGACVVILFLAAFGHQITSFKYGEAELFLKQAKIADELGDDEAREAFLGAALSAASASKGLSEDIDVTSKSFLHRMNVNTLHD